MTRHQRLWATMRSPARQRRRARKATRGQREHGRERAYLAWRLPASALTSIWRQT